MSDQIKNAAILLIHCPDKPGIVVAITEFIHNNGGNILYLDQHVDSERGVFFMRIEWDLENFAIQRNKVAEYFGCEKDTELVIEGRPSKTYWLVVINERNCKIQRKHIEKIL